MSKEKMDNRRRDAKSQVCFTHTKKLLSVLGERKPALAVLENVLGIAKVMTIVCRMLAKLGCYFVIVVKLDSQDLGVPIARPRYYFILVRKNAAITVEPGARPHQNGMW